MQAQVNGCFKDRGQEITVKERQLVFEPMQVDILEMVGKVAPLVVQQKEQVDSPAAVYAPKVRELLPDSEERHRSEGCRDVSTEYVADDVRALLLEERRDRV